ncbi:hypothetical protein NEHOM01_0936 [Nematocida homosporus]|uniref:uncharacterized protein n=1 Tax=Nematocida homosporus TaxID=1912981 RepID=UPI00221E64B2|nr:uncharacterized protein NEHOM01_0936 [Nematocida homosporus]KAI5185610.1 hypothetical protein NEHOM01_0936 [Nematocida homosporus]
MGKRDRKIARELFEHYLEFISTHQVGLICAYKTVSQFLVERLEKLRQKVAAIVLESDSTKRLNLHTSLYTFNLNYYHLFVHYQKRLPHLTRRPKLAEVEEFVYKSKLIGRPLNIGPTEVDLWARSNLHMLMQVNASCYESLSGYVYHNLMALSGSFAYIERPSWDSGKLLRAYNQTHRDSKKVTNLVKKYQQEIMAYLGANPKDVMRQYDLPPLMRDRVNQIARGVRARLRIGAAAVSSFNSLDRKVDDQEYSYYRRV